METLKAIALAFAIMLAFFGEILLVVSVAYVILRIVDRFRKSHRGASDIKQPDRSIKVDRGSLAWIDPGRRVRQPVAFAIALLAGAIGTVGVVLYWIGPLAGDPVIGLIGFGLGGIGTIAAGIIFGTSDRDYYI